MNQQAGDRCILLQVLSKTIIESTPKSQIKN